jgi:hypothetical protein
MYFFGDGFQPIENEKKNGSVYGLVACIYK